MVKAMAQGSSQRKGNSERTEGRAKDPIGNESYNSAELTWQSGRVSLPVMALWDLPPFKRNSSLIQVGGKQRGGIQNTGVGGQGRTDV